MTYRYSDLLLFVSGRIVNISSVRGLMPAMYGAAYNISKYGMETFSDILRLEMKKFDVTVCIVEPCSFGGVTKVFVSDFSRILPSEQTKLNVL